ncbi:FRG domain-containing protein [Endothiovibrio diazotrophicus]
MNKRPFTQDQPAKNIYELIEYFENNRSSVHYFRGQTNYYNPSTPSAYRNLTKEPSDDGEWALLNTEMRLDGPDREGAKSDLRQAIMLGFGKLVGNVLNQQYGISSDAFDITAEPTIAAFFATHSYPYYKPYEKQSDQDLGVIYRFNITTKNFPTQDIMDRTIMGLYAYNEDTGQRFWFDEIRSIPARILDAARRKDYDFKIDKKLDEIFPDGYGEAALLRCPLYVSNDLMEKAFMQSAEKIGLRGPLEIYRSSRIWQQKAGLYFPPTLHRCFISRTTRYEQLNERDFLCKPSHVESLGAHQVYNMNANPYIERYYFRHDPGCRYETDNLNKLWPSIEEDGLLQLIDFICKEELKDYLSDQSTTPMDPTKGLIDRGYLE